MKVVFVAWAMILLMVVALSWASEALSASAAGVAFDLDIGRSEDVEHIAFGWSSPERDGDRRFRWINRLEADLFFSLETVEDVQVQLIAARYYVEDRVQNIGLFVNKTYVTEWVCHEDEKFHAYAGVIPASVLVPGENRITLRMGYAEQPPRDGRTLSLAVDKITLMAMRE